MSSQATQGKSLICGPEEISYILLLMHLVGVNLAHLVPDPTLMNDLPVQGHRQWLVLVLALL